MNDREPGAVVPRPRRDRRDGVVRLKALRSRKVGLAQQAHLARDGLEDLGGGQPARDEGGNAQQRCLLVGEHSLRRLGLLGLPEARSVHRDDA